MIKPVRTSSRVHHSMYCNVSIVCSVAPLLNRRRFHGSIERMESSGCPAYLSRYHTPGCCWYLCCSRPPLSSSSQTADTKNTRYSLCECLLLPVHSSINTVVPVLLLYTTAVAPGTGYHTRTELLTWTCGHVLALFFVRLLLHTVGGPI